ncbi:MAG: hypothetical protein CMQ34_03755 [Gammaproteobacteria bacterium]|nr:hypothetical protein [Gammaproteobacteria bacterium]
MRHLLRNQCVCYGGDCLSYRKWRPISAAVRTRAIYLRQKTAKSDAICEDLLLVALKSAMIDYAGSLCEMGAIAADGESS